MQKFALRLMWRYKVFVLIGLLIVAAQLFLAYKLLRIPLSGNETTEERDLSRKLYEKYMKKPSTADEAVGMNLSAASNEEVKAKQREVDAGKNGNHAANKPTLRLEELDFVPPCEITRKDTISAIHRAKSQGCKAKIVDVACKIDDGTFYPAHLPNYCPRGAHSPNRALGCFRDEKDFRLLSGYFTTFKGANSPEKCIRLCLQSGYPFAGVQYGYECFCGDDEPKVSVKLPDSSCNMRCPGDAKQACGGFFTMNVYETGIRKFAARTTEGLPKPEEESVRIVFLLTLNGRAVRQVRRLLKALYSSRHFYYVHIDARQEYLYRELLELESQFTNIRLARRRFSSIWGGASLLQMLQSSMEYLLRESGWQWDFVLNLSESDFPLKTIDQLATFLTANRGQNFVRNHGREVQRFIQKQGLDMTFVECDHRMWRLGERTLPAGVVIDGGSDWVCLSREFAQYVAIDGDSGERDALVRGLLRVFEYTILPAESFFHTALRNSRFCHTYTNNNLHMTNWKRQLGCKCQYRHIVDWCGCSPNNFKGADWERLQGSQHKKLFFARKFEALVNQAIVLQLEEWIFGPYPADYPNLHAYWQNVYHHEDTQPSSGDGALLNVAHSLIRLNARSNAAQFYEPQRVLQITHYLERDAYRGLLIRHEALLGDSGTLVELETWVSPSTTAKVTRSTPLARRLIHLEVSTDYDEKEQLSRNFQRIIGTNAEPALIFRLAQPTDAEKLKSNSTNHSLTVEWIDPLGAVASSNHFLVEDNPSGPVHSFNHFQKGNRLKQPLREGVWSSRLLHDKALVGVTRFLVASSTYRGRDLPEQHTHRQPLPLTDPRKATRGAATSRTGKMDRYPRHGSSVGHSGDHERADPRHVDALDDQQLQDQQLEEQVPEFFKIRETCLIDVPAFEARNGVEARFVDCSSTSWSSLAPDPKSDLYGSHTVGRVSYEVK